MWNVLKTVTGLVMSRSDSCVGWGDYQLDECLAVGPVRRTLLINVIYEVTELGCPFLGRNSRSLDC